MKSLISRTYCKQSSFSDWILFFGLAALLTWESVLVFFLINRDLGISDNSTTGYVRFAYTYFLIFFLLFFAYYNQFIQKKFKYSWIIPGIYIVLCCYASTRSEGRSLNSILGFIFRPLVGISCMLTCEYMSACFVENKLKKLLDVLFFSIFLYGTVMVANQLVFSHKNIGNYEAVNNIYFVIPLSIYWLAKKKIFLFDLIQYITVLISILSLKRGAIIATASIFFYKTIISKKNKVNIKSIFNFIVSLILMIAIFLIADEFVFNGYLIERFQSIDDGSGRKGQFLWAIDELKHTPFSVLLVGYGMGASQQKYYGEFIHNDWLLLLYDFGIIGMLIYSGIYIYLFIYAHRLWKHHSPYLLAWTACCIFLVMLSLFSAVTWLFVVNVLPVLGCILGLEKQRTLMVRKNVLIPQKRNLGLLSKVQTNK